MKSKNKIFSAMLSFLMFSLCLNCHASDVKKNSIYSLALEGICRRPLDYSNNPDYNVISSSNINSQMKDMGYSEQIHVMHEKFDINYLRNWHGIIIMSVSIDEKNDVLPLGKYIGVSKEEFIKAFPLEEKDSDSGNVIFYKSDKTEKVQLGVIFKDGVVYGITVHNGEYMKKFAEYVKKQKG